MAPLDNTTLILYDLLSINSDRVEEYKTASYKVSELDMKSLFGDIADEGRKHVTEITKEIIKRNPVAVGSGDFVKDNAGKIYKLWLNQTVTLNVTNHALSLMARDTLLDSCEVAQRAILAAYKTAKQNSTSHHVNELIGWLEQPMQTFLEVIRAYRHYETDRKVYINR